MIRHCTECHSNYESENGKPCPVCYPAGLRQSKETIIWHPGNKPPKPDRYLITRNEIPLVSFDDWQCPHTKAAGWGFFRADTIIAWADMPKGWKGVGNE